MFYIRGLTVSHHEPVLVAAKINLVVHPATPCVATLPSVLDRMTDEVNSFLARIFILSEKCFRRETTG